jgi:hypothetical protein
MVEGRKIYMSTFLRQFLREFEDYAARRKNMRAVSETDDIAFDDTEDRPKYVYRKDAVEM